MEKWFIVLILFFCMSGWAETVTPSTSRCLKVRSTPKKGRVKRCLKSGSPMKVLSRRGNWIKVNYGGGTGWTYAPMTRSYSGSHKVAPVAKSYVTPSVSSCLNLRNRRRGGKVLQCIKPGEKMEVLSRRGNRTKVKVGNRVGYVYSKMTKKHAAQPAKVVKPAKTPQKVAQVPAPEKKPASAKEPKSQSPGKISENSKPSTEGHVSPVGKQRINNYLSETCAKIKKKKNRFPSSKVRKATRYFTPIFKNLTDVHPVKYKGRYRKNRYWCVNMEGSCRVGNRLYNYGKYKNGIQMNKTQCKFGFGNGKNRYNKTNCLDPCRTVATHSLPTGSVVYFPSLDGKICPQTGKKVDGCFIVGDVGDAIRGKGRFDLFAGECKRYSGGVCKDKHFSQFKAPPGSKFYVVGRHNKLAKELREESDMIVQNRWSDNLFQPITDVFSSVFGSQ